jgi:hypothetical protein
MPYKHDPRRTVTLNLPPAEYAALAEDALHAGYASPGTYALALVRARGEAPAPVQDERAADRQLRMEAKLAWLQAQFEALGRQLRRAGLQPEWAEPPLNEPRPRSWSAQQRAIRPFGGQGLGHRTGGAHFLKAGLTGVAWRSA